MKTAFKILPQLQQGDAFHLLIEVGWDVLSFVYFTKDPLCIEALDIYYAPATSSAQSLVVDLEKHLNNANLPNRLSTHIFYAFREQTLLPSLFAKEANSGEVLDALFGANYNTVVHNEQVNKLGLVVTQRVDKQIESLLLKYFPEATIQPSLACHLQKWDAGTNALMCTVYAHSFQVLLFKNGQIQLARSFMYNTPTDVAYHLLNVCTQHDFSPEQEQLILSGFIDHKSNLYDELYRYFLNISFHTADAAVASSQAVSQYPAHFFS
ncbi:MAG: DUF3822 family protein, partial [Chitinophagaceae bacterium]